MKYIDSDYYLSESLVEHGFMLIKNALSQYELNILNNEYDKLIQWSRNIIDLVKNENLKLGEFYKRGNNNLIVVPEIESPQEPCRFEHIAHCSAILKEIIINKVKHLIEEQMDTSFVLFKDKCNVKNPGGGAFPPHQDIAAYQHFKPSFHMTAAVILDASNKMNGCLEMAIDYKNYITPTNVIKTKFGEFPLFDYYRGGVNNGDIKSEISSNFQWQPIEANQGDVIIFNSFVPHQSKRNESNGQRRNFFFTFNAIEEGDWYSKYYERKRQNFDDPIFHVSTPTEHCEQ